MISFLMGVFLQGEEFVELETGFDRGGGLDFTEEFRRISANNEIAPVALLFALQNEEGTSMLARLGDYGFLMGGGARPEIPSGFSLREDSFLGFDVSLTGVSCAACHMGEFVYEGQRYRVDGMPGMVDVEGWTVELADSVDRLRGLSGIPEVVGVLRRALSYSVDNGEWEFLRERFGLEGLREKERELAEFERSLAEDLERLETAGEGLREHLGWPSFGELFGRLSDLDGVDVPGFLCEWQPNSWFCQFADRIRTEIRLLQERFETGEKLIELVRKSPPAGVGRDDAWGLIDQIGG
ncbi:MAG: hypothetical protein AAGC74_11830, partial [Verrucomicrobiota bacterium]